MWSNMDETNISTCTMEPMPVHVALANAQLDQLDIWLAHPPMTPHFNIGMSHGKEQEGTYGSSHNEAMVL